MKDICCAKKAGSDERKGREENEKELSKNSEVKKGNGSDELKKNQLEFTNDNATTQRTTQKESDDASCIVVTMDKYIFSSLSSLAVVDRASHKAILI